MLRKRRRRTVRIADIAHLFCFADNDIPDCTWQVKWDSAGLLFHMFSSFCAISLTVTGKKLLKNHVLWVMVLSALLCLRSLLIPSAHFRQRSVRTESPWMEVSSLWSFCRIYDSLRRFPLCPCAVPMPDSDACSEYALYQSSIGLDERAIWFFRPV